MKFGVEYEDWSNLIDFRASKRLKCGLNFRKVFGGFPANVEGTDGSVLLKTKEGINFGKTFAWFEYGSRTRATYVFKMDTDTAIHPGGLLSTILDAHVKHYQYIGFAMTDATCGRYSHCPKAGDGWTYMSGAFYGVKRHLLETVVRDDWVKSPTVGIEDILVGRWLYKVHPGLPFYNLSCVYEDTGFCPIRHYQSQKTKAAKGFLSYKGRRLSVPFALRRESPTASLDDPPSPPPLLFDLPMQLPTVRKSSLQMNGLVALVCGCSFALIAVAGVALSCRLRTTHVSVR